MSLYLGLPYSSLLGIGQLISPDHRKVASNGLSQRALYYLLHHEEMKINELTTLLFTK